MQMKINTIKLQEMLSKAVKGVGNNKLLPKTSLMSIRLHNTTLTITTTDATNYLNVREQGVMGDDFYVAVEADTFAKLIAKMSCEYVTLELKDNYLNVIGNGSYKITIPIDEDGEPVEFTDPTNSMSVANKIGSISRSVLNQILTSVKPSLAITMDYPCYTSYFVSDSVVATDTYKVSVLNKAIIESPCLISSSAMDLLSVISSDMIDIYADGDQLLFRGDNITVYTVEAIGIEEYAIEAIHGLAEQSFHSSCKVSKNELLRTLDRINLFVDKGDKGEVCLTFNTGSLMVESKQSNGVETIGYVSESVNPKIFQCSINVNMLMTQVKAQSGDTVEIHYGEDNAIKIVDGDVTSIVALLME